MDYSKKTAQECREDYELHGVTVSINDGKVSGSSPAGGLWGAVEGALGSGDAHALEPGSICAGGKIPFQDGTAGAALRVTEGL